MIDDLVIAMAGSGGDGIVSAGESLLTAVAAEGYYAILTKSFGSQIRGGESSCRLRVSTRPVLNPGGTLDVAVALNWDNFLRFGNEVPVGPGTVVIYESASGVAPDQIPIRDVRPEIAMPVPIGEMAAGAAGGSRLLPKNTVVLGLLCGWFGLAERGVLEGVRKKFASKGADVLAANERAFAAGIEFAAANTLPHDRHLQPSDGRRRKLLTDGNDICGAAAIVAGCRFFGGYPITPSSEIMHFLNREIWKYGGTILQAEDEIAGIGSVVGASFAGVKAMTATSGPGLSLKCEMLGLATIAELPLVCVNVQRGGPSTGLPTKSEQSDLFASAFSAHGDALRPILAPTCVADMFDITVEAFNIAERYQTPVIILADQEIAQRKETIDPIDVSRFEIVERARPSGEELREGYRRFRSTESGVSPISHPGMAGGNYLASGIEHDESGAPSVKGAVHGRMSEKRFRKLLPLQGRRDLFLCEGDPDARIGLISWGSVAGIAREAVRLACDRGTPVRLLVPKLLYPVSEEIFAGFFAGLERGLVIEQSYQAQFYRILRMWTRMPDGFAPFHKTSSNPFAPEEILERVRELAGTLQPAPAPKGGRPS